MTGVREPYSARASALSFALVVIVVTVAAAGILILLDPRSWNYWVARWTEWVTLLGELFAR